MRALALLPLLALAACDVETSAARAVLQDEGVTDIELSHVPYFDRPCQKSEVYALRFVGKREGRAVEGVICATGEDAQNAVLRAEFDVAHRWRPRGAR